MNPLRQDDPRHLKAVEAARDDLMGRSDPCGNDYRTAAITTNIATASASAARAIAAYFASLKAQGVVLIEAYAGDDTGR